ncbi:MAG TPA: hypothetical protein VNL37_01965 [Candidatus Polarisedimenticolia bacterium]|nr:hypothetical protein [Candidatus Polarisedimenticolia bacterium]
MRRSFQVPLVLLATLAMGAPCFAQGAKASGTSGIHWSGWGVRVGLSSNPDQIYGGVHFNLGEFAPNVRFRPTVEFGKGDHVTLSQVMAEAHYIFSKVQVWKPYVGGGVGWTHVKVDRGRSGDGTDNSIGLMGIGGIETHLKSAAAFFLELKVGLGNDDPDLKMAAGWTWK